MPAGEVFTALNRRKDIIDETAGMPGEKDAVHDRSMRDSTSIPVAAAEDSESQTDYSTD